MGELDSTYGAIVIGAFVAAVLFGITNLQTFIYFQRYPSDRLWNKLSVCWLWLLDAVHLALCIHMVYWYLVTDYLNPAALLDIVWSFKAQIIVDAIVVVSVHSLYTIRLWKLNAADSRKSVFRTMLPIVVSCIVVFGGYATALILCYKVFVPPHISTCSPLMVFHSTRFTVYTDLLATQWVTYLPLGAATFVDIIIALSLCYFLERCRTRSTSNGIDSTITLLMVYTLNTGVITSLCSLTAIVTMAALPTTFAVISVEFILTKLYVNSFLAMFNARSKLRGLGSIVDGDALAHPLSSTSSPTDRKAPAFAFSPTNSTGRSDLRVSICLDPRERAPVVDVNVEHGLSIHFPWPATRSNSAGSCEDRDVPLVSISKPMPLVPRARPRRVPSPLDSASSATATVTTVADSYTQFGRARVPKRSAYDVFTPKRPDSSLLGNMDEVWDTSPSLYTTRAQTPSSLIGMAFTKDV
ncbi:hypothetical protein C8Q72DRAFT_889705 [Fomitopsis betulina]|nr:hypothetical protein C8Q72DRAFT_889705 [Fomitopsis betulina]